MIIDSKAINKYIDIINVRNHNKHSVTYVVLVLWSVYFVFISYMKAWFNENGTVKYYLQIVFMLIIFWYEFYQIMRDVSIKKINLLMVYNIMLIVQYMILLSGLEKVVLLSALLLNIYLFKKYPMRYHEMKWIYWIFAIAVLLKIMNGTTVENMSDKTKFNPNECAVALMCLFCMSLVGFVFNKKICLLIIACGCFALQFYFRSRGALFGCLLFTILFVIFRAWKRTIRVDSAKILIFILSLTGVMIAFIYSEILYPLLGKDKIVILGKDLFTGRQYIWNLTFDSIKNNLILGVGNDLNADLVLSTQNSIFMNAHNQALGILASFGIINFIIFYILFSKLTAMPLYGLNTDRTMRAPIIFIMVITMMNYFEIFFFSQWAMPMILVAYAFILNNYRIKEMPID